MLLLAGLECCNLVGASLGPWVGAWTEIEAGIATMGEAGIATRIVVGVEIGIVAGIEIGIVARIETGIATRIEAGIETGIVAGIDTGIGTLTMTNLEGETHGKVQMQCGMKRLVLQTLGVLRPQGCVTTTSRYSHNDSQLEAIALGTGHMRCQTSMECQSTITGILFHTKRGRQRLSNAQRLYSCGIPANTQNFNTLLGQIDGWVNMQDPALSTEKCRIFSSTNRF